MKIQNRALHRLSKRAFRANRARNAFAILAVALTVLLLTCVFSIGFSFSKNLATMEQRTKGSVSQLILPNPTQAQLQKLRTLPYLQAAGIEIDAGMVQPSAESNSVIHVVHLDETQWKQHIQPCIGDLQGRLPQAENEVMLSSHALALLGLESPREGMEVALPFSGAPNTPFILCGWYTEYTATPDGKALLSEAYCSAHGLTAEQQGTAFLSVKKGEEKEIIPRLMADVQPADGQGILGGAEAGSRESNIPAMFGAAILVLLIALSGYLLIANVMNLSVSHDIRFYGLLKTLGAQERQLGRIVRRQALLFAAIGIPSGLIVGALACFGVVPFAMRIAAGGAGSSAFPAEVSFQPLIFLGAAFFALITVLLGCRRPARTVRRLSPIAALRQTGAPPVKRTQIKCRTHSPRGRLARMAWRNVFRDRRRAALLFTSMSLGIVLFLSIGALMDALGGESYFNAKYPYDFVCSVRNAASVQVVNLATDEEMDGATLPDVLQADELQKIIDKIQKTDGVTQTDAIRSTDCTLPFDEALWEPVLREAFLRISAQQAEEASMPDGELQLASGASYADFVQQMKARGEYRLRVYSVSDLYIAQYNRTHTQPLDVEAFRRGELCLIGSGGYEAMRGRQFTLTSQGGGRAAPLTVGGIWDGPVISQAPSAQTGYLDGIYISEALMERLDSQAAVERICVNTRPENEPAVKTALEALEKEHPNAFSVSSKTDARAEQGALIQTMQVLGGGLSLLLLLIGLLNFVNVMFTCVLTRRREFALMESIGLTKRQLFALLAWEGLILMLVTSALSLAASAVVYEILSKSITAVIPYADFSFPLLPAAGMIAGLLAVCLMTAATMYRYSARDSVTQRLRETEE